MFDRAHSGHLWIHLRHLMHAGHGGGRHGHHGRHGGWDDGGRHGRGPFGGGRGRVFGPGDLRLVLLALIAEKPRHGYELIKELEQKFGGGYAPSPGSVYPTLTLLEELGHVSARASEGTKRLFEITAEGTRYLRENAAALDSARARMEMAARAVSGDIPPAELHHAMHTLKASLMFHRGGWDERETRRVRSVLEAAAAAIAGGGEDE
ncbi:MAG TPA: PadR family transcriptional regulator [Steroidobacteraceae bacterium]|nr:PadR family transcriptional regulator [Steroidobacteraceae bacterium]